VGYTIIVETWCMICKTRTSTGKISGLGIVFEDNTILE
jgi:hypothetical protein